MFHPLHFHSQTSFCGFMKLIGQHFLFLTVNILHTSGVTVSFWAFWELSENVSVDRGKTAHTCMHNEGNSVTLKWLYMFQSCIYSSSLPCNLFHIYFTPYFSCWGLVKIIFSHLIKPVWFSIRHISKNTVKLYVYL